MQINPVMLAMANEQAWELSHFGYNKYGVFTTPYLFDSFKNKHLSFEIRVAYYRDKAYISTDATVSGKGIFSGRGSLPGFRDTMTFQRVYYDLGNWFLSNYPHEDKFSKELHTYLWKQRNKV